MRRSTQRQAVLDVIRQEGPIGPLKIATALNVRTGSVRFLLGRLVKENAIFKVAYGRYRAIQRPWQEVQSIWPCQE